MGLIIGIDLGTTNSVVACVTGGRVETIANSEGSRITPSVVMFGEQELVVGDLAKRQSVTKPGLVIRSAKRLMGRRYSEISDHLEDFPYEVIQGKDDRAEIRLSDGRIIPPELVGAHVLMKMRDTAEEYFGDAVTSAVITVPAYFNDAQRTATKHAAEIAELEVIRIINEPTAAALAFGIDSKGPGQKIAIFDFGGGTFDISILQLQGDIFEVLATNGNTSLGGDNIDLKIFQEISDGILQKTGVDPTRDTQAAARIWEAAERAKIELSSLTSTHLSLPFIVSDAAGPKHFEMDIRREQFNRWMAPIFDKLFDPCKECLRDAHLKVGDIDEVVLVGGSTRIPRVQQLVAEFFQREPNQSTNPDEAVAVGAAIQAGVMRGELAELLLLDITPLSLGIELAGGVFKPLISRNSSIPCEATRKFTTVIDNQVSVMVHVLQGERAKASENRSLAQFRLTGIAPMPKELPEIEVRFCIDADGILEVSAVELTSGASTGIQVEGYGAYAPMSEEEMRKLLEDVAQHGAEDEQFVREANRRSQAQRVQDRIQRILDECADIMMEADLKKIKETMLRHDLALGGREWLMVETHESILVEMIEKYEGSAELHRVLNRKLEVPKDISEPRIVPPSHEQLTTRKKAEPLPEHTSWSSELDEPLPGMVRPDSIDEVARQRASGTHYPISDPSATRAPLSKKPVKQIKVRDGRVEEGDDDFDPQKAPPPPPVA